MSHAHATLTPITRLRMAKQVIDHGWTYAAAAKMFMVAPKTAEHVMRRIVEMRWRQRLAVNASLDKWLGENYRLGLTEYRALNLLSQASDKEPWITVLAQRVGLTSTSTTRLVSRLEAKATPAETCARTTGVACTP